MHFHRLKKHKLPYNSENEKEIFIYGLHTVRAALQNPKRLCYGLFLTPNTQRRFEEEFLALRPQLPIQCLQPRALTVLLGEEAVHQGVALRCAALPPPEVESFRTAQRILLLDRITDPHNVGAILRSAAAFKVDLLVTPLHHTPQETAALAKAASGALESVPIQSVTNVARFIESACAAGFWAVALDSAAPLLLEQTIQKGPLLLVLGAEDKGVRPAVRRACDATARLNLPGSFSVLNVSNAAALALYTCHLAWEQ